jgi:CheY-like chemotaxis protein
MMARILIIEDDAIISQLLAQLLMQLGHTVSGVAATEVAAVEAAAADRPDVMLVDSRLREGSGRGAVEHILRAGFIPHVYMSGFPAAPDRLGPGVAALRKPFSHQALQLAVAEVLRTAGITPAGAGIHA